MSKNILSSLLSFPTDLPEMPAPSSPASPARRGAGEENHSQDPVLLYCTRDVGLATPSAVQHLGLGHPTTEVHGQLRYSPCFGCWEVFINMNRALLAPGPVSTHWHCSVRCHRYRPHLHCYPKLRTGQDFLPCQPYLLGVVIDNKSTAPHKWNPRFGVSWGKLLHPSVLILLKHSSTFNMQSHNMKMHHKMKAAFLQPQPTFRITSFLCFGLKALHKFYICCFVCFVKLNNLFNYTLEVLLVECSSMWQILPYFL